jgi:linoleoyl-CoA desaturase
VTLLVGGTLLFLMNGHWALQALGAFLAAVGCVGIGSNTHTSSHFATGRSPKLNRRLTHFGYGFCLGFPAVFWWSDHCKGHHAGPNVLGIDDDFDYAPIFAIDKATIAQAVGWKRWYYENIQWLFLILSMPLMSFNLQRRGIEYLVAQWREQPKKRKELIPDMLCIGAHFFAFLVLPSFFFPVLSVVCLYLLRMSMVSIGLFVILVPGHFPVEAPLLTEERAREMGWAATQTLTTVNYNGGFFFKWLASGLGYQIEHHLFPEISHSFYPKISPYVRAFCKEHNLEYRSYTLRLALYKSIKVFLYPKSILS